MTPTFGALEKMGRYTVTLLRRLGYRASLRVVRDVTRWGNIASDSRNRIPVTLSGWIQDYPAPSNFVRTQFTCESFHPNTVENANWGGFCDPRLLTSATSVRSAT